MLTFLVVACTGAGPQTPSTSESGHTGTPAPSTASTGHTGHTGTTGTDTGWVPPGTLFAGAIDATAQCVDTGYPIESTVAATSEGGGVVSVDYAGEVYGCTCGDLLFAWTAEPATLDLRVGAGDCDLISCCEVSGTVSGVPAGDWTVRMRTPAVTLATTTVTVP